MPALIFSKPTSLQRAHEDLAGQAEVAILLHVEVDELRHARAIAAREGGTCRAAIQALQAVAQRRDRVLAGDGRHLRVERGDFHRENLRLRLLQGLEIQLQPTLRLGFTQDRLTEKVHIHAHALFTTPVQMLGQQLPFGRQDHIGRLLPHVFLHHWHRNAGQPAAEGLEAAQHRAIQRTEETRHALHIEDVRELIRHPRRRLRTKRLVRELHERGLVRRRLQHAIQLHLLALLRRCLQLRGAKLELPRHGDGFGNEIGVHGCAGIVSRNCFHNSSTVFPVSCCHKSSRYSPLRSAAFSFTTRPGA
jgi:hypothetical protein